MTSDQDSMSQQIEDGRYFYEARQWYNLLYIGPIPERIFFLIITSISLVIFVFAITSVYNLLPIKPRVPFVYRASDMLNELPSMIRFKAPNEPSNPALIKYHLGLYTTMRESYDEKHFLLRWAYAKHYSDPSAFQEYDRLTNPNNPRSAIRQFGKYSDVKVTIESVTYNREVIPYKGVVNYSTELVGPGVKKKTNWTANLTFEYTDLTETDHFDEKLKDYVLTYKEPTFRVLSYEARERLAMESGQ